jgi:hypothetical protein
MILPPAPNAIDRSVLAADLVADRRAHPRLLAGCVDRF